METKLIDIEENPLMDRKEIELLIDHEKEATPSKENVKSRFAAEEDIDKEDIKIESVKTLFGDNSSTAKLKVYSEIDYDEREVKGDNSEISEEYQEIVSDTITEAKQKLNEMEEPDYKQAKAAEKNNKNRKTLIDWLNQQIEKEVEN